MLRRFSTLQWLSRAGLWCLGLAVTLLSGPPAWAQQTADKEPSAEANVNKPDRERSPAETCHGTDVVRRSSRGDQQTVRKRLGGQARCPRCGRHSGDPEHEWMLMKARGEVELLEAQIEAKKAQARLVEARLEQVRNRHDALKKQSSKSPADDERRLEAEGEERVLEAELDAERAEIKEPQVLLKYARRRLENLESFGEGPGAMPRGRRESMGMRHPGMMRGYQMDDYPDDPYFMSMDSMMDVDDRLIELREAIENLEDQVERLATRSRR